MILQNTLRGVFLLTGERKMSENICTTSNQSENIANNRIIFFDSTLRDGEQIPGAAMTLTEKIKIAQQLTKMGVDVIEAGFAGSSPTDWMAIRLISEQCASEKTKICSLSRCHEKDIQASITALAPAIQKNAARIHVFVATSEKHMKTKLGKTKEEVLNMIRQGVGLAKKYVADIEFSAEDAFNSDRDFLAKCIKTAIQYGATTINLPDTVGEAAHFQYYEFIKDIIDRVQSPQHIVFSVHCHNDKGLATSNSLMGLMAGARQVECCMNGLGERAGNAALEEIAMAIQSSPNVYPFEFQLDTTKITETAHLVSALTGIKISPCKAVVGQNAFSHASGVHQDGVLKGWAQGIQGIYGAINPKSVGAQENIVITRHSGIRAVMYMMEKIGVPVSSVEATAILERIKCSGKKIISPELLVDMKQAGPIKARHIGKHVCIPIGPKMIRICAESQFSKINS